MTTAGLHINGVTAGYSKGMPIVHSVSLSALPQEIVTIIGPNGAGKSTLLKAIAGLLPIDKGTLTLNSQSIRAIRPDSLARSGIAFVPQLDNVFRHLSIDQNLKLASKRLKRHERSCQISTMLKQFPTLKEKQFVKAGALSGGQRQFLAVAMALIAKPKLLLLDEPTAGLSPKAAQDVLQQLGPIASEGVAIVMVEQNVRFALKTADRAYLLAEGRNQFEGNANELLHTPILANLYLGGKRQEELHGSKSV